ncbi:DinB family protein [Candidatus Thorarchaeota archaeon]|nr:MAG: DinB family protein [Candidatus Thorarchaeota archaeon]
MMYKMIVSAVRRHLEETLPLVKQLTEVNVMSRPIDGGREIGEVVLHLVRSLEYYLKGITTSQWEPPPYFLETYDSAESIIELTEKVFKQAKVYTSLISTSDLGRKIESFNRPTTVAELILEMIEHSIHHRGQITVYYRHLGVDPTPIPYII